MEGGKKQGILLCSLLALLLLVALVGSTDGSRIHRDTEAAMDEMSQLFRRLFPLVPERTQYFWRTNQLGSALVYNEELPRNVDESPSPSETVLPWKLQIEFRKRGPDCMKKCISQGVLHPVQCHSLCWLIVHQAAWRIPGEFAKCVELISRTNQVDSFPKKKISSSSNWLFQKTEWERKGWTSFLL